MTLITGIIGFNCCLLVSHENSEGAKKSRLIEKRSCQTILTSNFAGAKSTDTRGSKGSFFSTFFGPFHPIDLSINDSFSWMCAMTLCNYKAQLNFFFVQSQNFDVCVCKCCQISFYALSHTKKEGRRSPKRMKINRWLHWHLWQFEQQCLKYW